MKSEIIQALDGLINSLKVFVLQHDFHKWEISEAKSMTKAKTLYSELRKHIDALQAELRGAVRIGTKYGLAMKACAEAIHTTENGVVGNAVFGELELLRLKVDDETTDEATPPPPPNDKIPASCRYEGTLSGAPLTAKFCMDRFGISSSTLSRQGKGHRIKVGHPYIYKWSFVQKLANEK